MLWSSAMKTTMLGFFGSAEGDARTLLQSCERTDNKMRKRFMVDTNGRKDLIAILIA